MDTFLTDLGADMLAVFNNKIAEWSLTNSIEKAWNTEGRANFLLSDFERLEKLLDLPVRLDNVFMPNDLFDFEAISDTSEQASNDKPQSSKARGTYFSDTKNLISKKIQLEKESLSFQNYSFDKTNIIEKKFVFDREKRIKTTEDTEKLPQILRGDKNRNFERNESVETASLLNNETVFSEIQTNRNEKTTASTIWERPLGNLGAFVVLSNSAPLPTQIPDDLLFSSVQQNDSEGMKEYEHREEARQKQQVLENQTPIKRIEEVFNKQDTPLFNNTFYKEECPTQTENIEFEPIDTERQRKYTESMTDADDLLDVLTERVRRDFQRFYP